MIRSILLLLALLLPGAMPAAAQERFPLCDGGPRVNCVVDGDTVWIAGEKIRIENIDTPESHQPQCPQEALWAAEATERLAELMNGGAVVIERTGTDRHGRTLARLSVGGRDIGERLVAEGLAREWTGRRQGWCG